MEKNLKNENINKEIIQNEKDITENIMNKKDNRDNNFMDLFFIKTNEKICGKILSIMYKIGKKYNNSFMDSNIFLQLEKFASPKEKKQIIVQYK